MKSIKRGEKKGLRVSYFFEKRLFRVVSWPQCGKNVSDIRISSQIRRVTFTYITHKLVYSTVGTVVCTPNVPLLTRFFIFILARVDRRRIFSFFIRWPIPTLSYLCRIMNFHLKPMARLFFCFVLSICQITLNYFRHIITRKNELFLMNAWSSDQNFFLARTLNW